jgi:hypothetical protein
VAGADLISVKDFIKQSSVWTQLTPTLEPVVRWANSHQASLGSAVTSLSDNQRNSLIAEAAFLLARSDFRYVAGNPTWVENEARKFLRQLPRSEASDDELTQEEWNEIGRLARVTQTYTARLSEPKFSASIPGCGVVDSARCDILAVDELVEIKTVTRPFRSSDFRQALTYAAMLYAAGRPVSKITLLNPRRAVFSTLFIAQIAAGARGDSAVELMQDLVERMTGLQVSA